MFEALKSFEVKVEGKTALDVGSSTGGFTQVLLYEGAAKITSIDVGTDQLHSSLRNVARISLLEQTDIRDRKILGHFLKSLEKSSLYFVKCRKAYITGKKGNQEIFVHLKKC